MEIIVICWPWWVRCENLRRSSVQMCRWVTPPSDQLSVAADLGLWAATETQTALWVSYISRLRCSKWSHYYMWFLSIIPVRNTHLHLVHKENERCWRCHMLQWQPPEIHYQQNYSFCCDNTLQIFPEMFNMQPPVWNMRHVKYEQSFSCSWVINSCYLNARYYYIVIKQLLHLSWQ